MPKVKLTFKIEKEENPWQVSRPWKVSYFIDGRPWFSNNYKTKKAIYKQLEDSPEIKEVK